MGAGASAGLSAAVQAASDRELAEALAGLPAADAQKLKAALSGGAAAPAASAPAAAAAGSLPMRALGKQGFKTSMQGYGCMNLTMAYGPAISQEEANAVLQKAFDLGVRHFDNAELYTGKTADGQDAHSEVMVGTWLKTLSAEQRAEVTLATKYWPMGEGDKAKCTQAEVEKAVAASCERFGVQCIDLYYLHRCPDVETTVSFAKACKKLIADGKIKYYGLSEATVQELRAAHEVHPITALQQEWSIVVRNLEEDLVPCCRELGIGIVAYSPLARGLATGLVKTEEDFKKIGNAQADPSGTMFQSMCPYMSGDNLQKNLQSVLILEREAQQLQVPTARLALAWLHAMGEDVFPIPGTVKAKNLEANVQAARYWAEKSGELSAVMAKINEEIKGFKIEGDRYPEFVQGLSYEAKRDRSE